MPCPANSGESEHAAAIANLTEASAVAEVIVAISSQNGITVATAESCTGGLVGGALTAIPGASSSYLGGIISYANGIKTNVLGVKAETLASYGAVSAECASEMALGACEKLNADFAVATTGIAGPGGATPAKPVGLVFIAATRRDGIPAVIRHIFPGDRTDVRSAAVTAALKLLLKTIREQ